MSDLQIPEEFKLLSNKGHPVGNQWTLRRTPTGHEFLSVHQVNWVAIPCTVLLVAVFGFLMMNAATWLGEEPSRTPDWLPWLFGILMACCGAGLLAFQVHCRRHNEPWLEIDSEAKEVAVLVGPKCRVKAEDIRRVHLASELLLNHAEGNRRRHFELSLLVDEGDGLRRIPLIQGLDRSLMIAVSRAIQKGLGFRKGSIEDALAEDES